VREILTAEASIKKRTDQPICRFLWLEENNFWNYPLIIDRKQPYFRPFQNNLLQAISKIKSRFFQRNILKIEPWIINGWQSYAQFNKMPGVGANIHG